MGLIELIIVILVLLWLFGYFGRGRLAGGGRTLPSLGGYDLIHVLLVVALVLIIVRLLT